MSPVFVLIIGRRHYRDEMKRFLYSQLGLAIPVVVAPAGGVTDDVLRIIEELAMNPCKIQTRCETALFAVCKEMHVPVPKEILAQIVPCRSLDEFVETCDRLSDETSMFFLQCFARILIIDYQANKNIAEVRQQCEQLLKQTGAAGFVYYRLDEDLADMFDSVTCIAFNSYSPTNVVNHVWQFVTPFVFQGWLCHPRLFSCGGDQAALISLPVVSANTTDVATAIRNAVASVVDDSPAMASILEIAGVFAHSGVFSKRLLERPVWSSEGGDETEEAEYLSTAMILFQKARMYEKAVDCALKLFLYGDFSRIEWIISMIKENVTLRGMKWRAREMIDICLEHKMHRKAVLYSFIFSEVFQDADQAEFQLLMLQMLRDQKVGKNFTLSMIAPVIIKLIHKDVDPKFQGDVISNVISVVGTNLSEKEQYVLFRKMAQVTIWGSTPTTTLHFTISSVQVLPDLLAIRKREITRESGTLFLYRCLDESGELKDNEPLHPLNKPIRISIEIRNPWSIRLPVRLMGKGDAFGVFQETTGFMEPKSSQKFTLTMTPTQIGKFHLDSIELAINGMHDIIKLPEPVTISIVDFQAEFFARTDLPLTSTVQGYIGQTLTFNLCMTNNGSRELSEIRIIPKSRHSFIIKSNGTIPVKPLKNSRFICTVSITEPCDCLDFDVACFSESDDFEAAMNFKQPLSIKEGITPVSIIALNARIDTPDLVLISMTFRNVASEAFSYKLTCEEPARLFSDENAFGFLGKSKTTSHVICIKQSILESENTEKPDGINSVLAAKQYQSKINRTITREERSNIVRLLNVRSVLERTVHFTWKGENGERGRVPLASILPDDSFLKRLFENNKPTYSFVQGGTACDAIETNEPVDFTINFGKTRIYKCELDFGDSEPDVLWDGSISYTDPQGRTEYAFRLYFTVPGEVNFAVKYKSKTENDQLFLYKIIN